MTEIALIIHGTPAPKGSLAYKGRNKKTGAPVMAEQLKASKPWRDRVAGAIAEYLVSHEGSTLKRGVPVGVEATFTFPRPKAHYGTGRNEHRLKPSAPGYPTGHNTGDSDKLLRNILDAMQDAGLVVDDAQVVEVTGRKTYPVDDATAGLPDALPHPGALVRVYPIRPVWLLPASPGLLPEDGP